MIFSTLNLPYWILLGAGVALFLVVIGAGGGDEEVDAEGDLDIEDPGIDGDDLEFTPLSILGWLGLGQMPLLLLLAVDLTLWGLLGWIFNVALGDGLGLRPEGLLALGVAIASLTIALTIGSILSRPIGKVFATFGEDVSGDRLVGCRGRVTSAFVPLEDSGKIGQVDVVDGAGNLVTLSVKLPQWAQISLRRGATVTVIDHQKGYYLVVAQDSIDETQWMGETGGGQGR